MENTEEENRSVREALVRETILERMEEERTAQKPILFTKVPIVDAHNNIFIAASSDRHDKRTIYDLLLELEEKFDNLRILTDRRIGAVERARTKEKIICEKGVADEFNDAIITAAEDLKIPVSTLSLCDLKKLNVKGAYIFLGKGNYKGEVIEAIRFCESLHIPIHVCKWGRGDLFENVCLDVLRTTAKMIKVSKDHNLPAETFEEIEQQDLCVVKGWDYWDRQSYNKLRGDWLKAMRCYDKYTLARNMINKPMTRYINSLKAESIVNVISIRTYFVEGGADVDEPADEDNGDVDESIEGDDGQRDQQLDEGKKRGSV